MRNRHDETSASTQDLLRVTTDTRKDERNNFFQQKLNELKKLTMEKIKTAVKASI